MRSSHVDGIRLAGVACAVPDIRVTTADDARTFGETEMQKIAQATGIRERRVAPQGVCTSDLCVVAAEALLREADTDRTTIDAVILVTQTPDYILPATACSIHSRLGLGKSCAAFDVNLGCSGYTYGLWMASHLMASGGASRILLLAGEIASRRVNDRDRSARPLFGDAGSASLLELDPAAGRTSFRYGSDGSGQNHLIVPAGSFRLPDSAETWTSHEDGSGNVRSLGEVFMDGAEVFLFTLSQVPPMLRGAVADAGWTTDEVDYFVLHQANEFMLKNLARSAKIPAGKLPLSLERFGNTSSASIPLTLTTTLRDELLAGPKNLVLGGFGVGLSWSSATFRSAGLVLPPLVEVPCAELLATLYGPESTASHLPESIRRAFHG